MRHSWRWRHRAPRVSGTDLGRAVSEPRRGCHGARNAVARASPRCPALTCRARRGYVFECAPSGIERRIEESLHAIGRADASRPGGRDESCHVPRAQSAAHDRERRHRQARRPRGARARRRLRRLPQRPALRRRPLPLPHARHPGPRGGGDRRGGRITGVGARAGRPRHRLPLRLLRPLRLLPHRQDAPLPDPARPRQERAAQAVVEGPARQPVRQSLGLCREDARARKRPREDRRHHAARPRRADRLRRDHGRGGGAQHGADRGRLRRRRLRRGRRGAGGDPGRAHRRGADDHRGGRGGFASSPPRRSWARPTRSMRRRAIRSRPSAS